MSKRNFILLIIVLVIAIIAIFGFLYFRNEPTAPPGEGEGTNFFSQFNPFGKSKPTPPPTTLPPTDTPPYEPGPGEETSGVKLKKVSSMPIAGFTVFQKERLKTEIQQVQQGEPLLNKIEFAPALRYVERATGNIFQTFADRIEERRFSSTVIPRIHDAYFGNNGESVVMRYLKTDDKTIETFIGTLPVELLGAEVTQANEVKGSFLPNNVKDVSVSPDASKIFYLFENETNMIGATLNLKDNKKVQVLDSPFTEWLSWWPNDKIITLSTKPSANIPGHMYTLDLSKKSLSKILGDISGLTTLASPDGKLVLYGNNNLSLSIYHTDTRTSDLLGVRTLPEKCVWNKIGETIYCAVPKLVSFGEYPDSWYQGEVSFEDQLWKIDVKSGNTAIISDPVIVVGGEEVDGIKLMLDESENYLFFVNKKDSFLWELNLK